MQSVPITTKVASTNPVHGEVYSIKHYVIKFVSDLRQADGFLRVLLFPSPIKLTAMHNIAEILLKVALNTIALTLHLIPVFSYPCVVRVYTSLCTVMNKIGDLDITQFCAIVEEKSSKNRKFNGPEYLTATFGLI